MLSNFIIFFTVGNICFYQRLTSLCGPSFLELSKEVYIRKFATKLFHKRYVFPFCVYRIPYLHSIISCKIIYSSIGSDVLRIGRTTTYMLNMATSVNILLIWIKKESW